MNMFEDLITTLANFFKSQTTLASCGMGWPDTKYLSTNGNLPGLFMVIPSSKPLEHRGRYYSFTESAADPNTNQGTITHVLGKRQYPIQCHIIAKTKAELTQIHGGIIDAVSTYWYIPLTDNAVNTHLELLDDFFLTKGDETNYHRSVVTVGASIWQLSSESAYGFKQAQISSTFGSASREVGVEYTLDESSSPPAVKNFTLK